MNFDLKPSPRVLFWLLVIKDFNHSFIWRKIGPGWSYDGGQALKNLLNFLDILIVSSGDGDNSARLTEEEFSDVEH